MFHTEDTSKCEICCSVTGQGSVSWLTFDPSRSCLPVGDSEQQQTQSGGPRAHGWEGATLTHFNTLSIQSWAHVTETVYPALGGHTRPGFSTLTAENGSKCIIFLSSQVDIAFIWEFFYLVGQNKRLKRRPSRTGYGRPGFMVTAHSGWELLYDLVTFL